MISDIFIDIRDQGATLSNYFKGRVFVSLEEVFTKFEEAVDDLEHMKEKYKELKQDVEENYKPLTKAEYYEEG